MKLDSSAHIDTKKPIAFIVLLRSLNKA